MSLNQNKSIILFDGFCNLCNASVVFIIKRDKNDYFRFAALQSETGKALVSQYEISILSDSVILIENGKYYLESTAALRIVKKLSGFWPMLYLFIILPSFSRNVLYNLISRNRYKWFGMRHSCWIPSTNIEEKFLL